MRFAFVLILLVACTAARAQPPALSSVQSRCARLEVALKGAAGVQQDLVAQALDDCRSEVMRLTPRKVSKLDRLAGYLAPTLALAQEGYAAKSNMDWLMARKRQKNAGRVEVNFSTEVVVVIFIGQGIGARAYRDWKKHRRSATAAQSDLHDMVTDAVLMPR